MTFEHPHLPDGYSFAEPRSMTYEEYALVYQQGRDWVAPSRETWQSQVRPGSGCHIVGVRVDETAELVGVGMLQAYGARVFINNLVVATNHRNHGLGSALVEARVAMADAMGIETVRTMLAPTNTVRGVYAHLGFVPEVGSPYHIRHT